MRTLSKRLRTYKNVMENASADPVFELFKQAPITYRNCITSLVYDKYSPQVYVRTGHIMGEHGSMEEDIKDIGGFISYKFYIDEGSKSPNDGASWSDKAHNLESGSTMMFNYSGNIPDRPFINDTMKELVKLLHKERNKFLKIERQSAKRYLY